jgi:tRNA A64-2'-O-ribosylphosphate transferase
LTTQDPKAVSLPIRARPDNGTPVSGSDHKDANTQEKSNDDPPQGPSLPSKLFAILSSTPKWSFHRTLTSTLPSHPSGTVTGSATFTACSLPPSSPPTLLYAEEGEFVTATGLKFTARRKYVYQLIDEGVVVKFFDDEKFPRAKVEDGVGKAGEGIGGMFVEMDALVASEGEVEAKNKEQHLCAEDLYAASWRFSKGMAGGDGPMWWEVRYDVKGPKKDYVSSTRYERGA